MFYFIIARPTKAVFNRHEKYVKTFHDFKIYRVQRFQESQTHLLVNEFVQLPGYWFPWCFQATAGIFQYKKCRIQLCCFHKGQYYLLIAVLTVEWIHLYNAYQSCWEIVSMHFNKWEATETIYLENSKLNNAIFSFCQKPT